MHTGSYKLHFPKNIYGKSQPPVPPNMTVFKYNDFADGITLI